MRLSEKLDAVMNNIAAINSQSKPTDLIHAAGKAADLLRDHAEDLRQALRDSERYAWMRDELPWTLSSVPHGGYKLTCHMPNVAKLDGIGPDNDDFDAAIDAAMGRREGETNG